MRKIIRHENSVQKPTIKDILLFNSTTTNNRRMNNRSVEVGKRLLPSMRHLPTGYSTSVETSVDRDNHKKYSKLPNLNTTTPTIDDPKVIYARSTNETTETAFKEGSKQQARLRRMIKSISSREKNTALALESRNDILMTGIQHQLTMKTANKDSVVSAGPSPNNKDKVGEMPSSDIITKLQEGVNRMIEKNIIISQEQVKDEQRLIYYIKLLFNDEKTTSEFIYATMKKEDMPYNLSIQPFEDIEKGVYFTISRDKVVKYEQNNSVIEIIGLREWLREKLRFNQLKTLDLVRKFRKIKTLRNWVRHIRRFKKSYSSKLIELKLPILDPLLSKQIFDFKSRCFEVEEFKYFYISSDKSPVIDELKSRQDKYSDIFQSNLESIDRQMNVNIEHIIKSFDRQMWDSAFADLSDELKGGLSSIEVPDGSQYEDEIPLEGQSLGFFHKLMSLNVPYRVKAKLRNLCHKVLSLPDYFDNLRLISLLNCHSYNIKRLDEFLMTSRRKNKSDPMPWGRQERSSKPQKRSISYLTLSVTVYDSFCPAEGEMIEERVEIGADGSEDLMNFDLASNFEERKYRLCEITDFDNSKLLEYIDLHDDLQALTNKSFVFQRQMADFMKVLGVRSAHSGILKVKPTLDELKNFLLEAYNDFLKVLSSFKRSSESGKFNLYFKILHYWENGASKHEYESEFVTLEEIIDEKARKEFTKRVVDPLGVDFEELRIVFSELFSLALQHWRNGRIDTESRIDLT